MPTDTTKAGGAWTAWAHSNTVGRGKPITGPTAAASLVARRAIDESRIVCDVPYVVVADDSRCCVALVFGDSLQDAESKAAKAAAAPLMLEALKVAAAELRAMRAAVGSGLMTDVAIESADAAIAAATAARTTLHITPC